MKNKKLDWNNISIIPAVFSDITSRGDIDIYYDNGELPIIASPMDTVIDTDNYHKWLDLNIPVCIPRTGENPNYVRHNNAWISVGLNLFTEWVENGDEKVIPQRTLVDVANGHMKRLYDASKAFKEKFPIKELMVGNIAHPGTYRRYAEIGVDAVRCGIGGGSVCTTSANGAIHYPMASLVMECRDIAKRFDKAPLIIADGGFKNYRDIILALAVGSNYVMLGGVFSKCLEACSPSLLQNRYGNYDKLSYEDALDAFNNHKILLKNYRGMSTKEVQKDWGRSGDELRTSEGIKKLNKVEYTLEGWTNNFIDYLRSNMSYVNARNLHEFIGKPELIEMSDAAFNRFFK